jgi:hypothetical protein
MTLKDIIITNIKDLTSFNKAPKTLPIMMGSRSVSWSVYWKARHPELQTYCDNLTTPISETQIINLGMLMDDIKTTLGVTLLANACDYIRIWAGETAESSAKNIVKDDHHATLAGTPIQTWTQNRGILGDGINGYAKSDYKPKSDASAVSLNSFTMFVYCLNNNADAVTDIGARKATGEDRTFINTRTSAGTVVCLNTDSSSGTAISGQTDSRGLTLACRSASNVTKIYKNKFYIGSLSSASAELPDFEIYEGALNTADTMQAPSVKEIAITGVIRGITDDEEIGLAEAFEKYMRRVRSARMHYDAKCWFARSTALYNSVVNQTWIGVIRYDGLKHIQALKIYNHTTESITYANLGLISEQDDHCEPSIIVRSSDSRLITAYSRHAKDKLIIWRISTNVQDASAWGDQSTFVSTGNVTYPSLFEASNGDIFITYRDETDGWCYIKSTDGGATFGGKVIITRGILEDTRPGYLIPAQSPADKDIIHFVLSSGHPYYDNDVSVYAFYLDLADGKFYKLDGTETTANLPFDAASDLTLVMASERPDEMWIEDIIVDASGNPRYLFTHFPNGKNVDYLTKDLYYSEWTGTALTTPYKIHTALVGYVHTGTDTGNNTYMPVACFNQNNPDVIIASKQVGSVCEIHKITRNAANSFATQQVTSGSPNDQWRPVSTKNTINNAFWLDKKYYDDYKDNYAEEIICDTI